LGEPSLVYGEAKSLEFSLKNKTILITGGTSLLGEAFVRKAAGQGARVFFTYFKNAGTAGELEKTGAKGFQLDLADPRAIEAFAEMFKKENEELDVLIHNAAATADALIEKMTEKEWDDVLKVNLKAPFYLTQKLLPLLMRKGDRQISGTGSSFKTGCLSPSQNQPVPSKVFMLVSRAGLSGLAGAANYAASKGGLIAMTKTLARELGRKKILVNAVNPGFMQSAITAGVPAEVLQRNLEESPLKTFSDPEEVAELLVFLSSGRMRQVTGQVFHFESRPL
jgi:3-oxoacyl-[acyl-carrier protein] reductase